MGREMEGGRKRRSERARADGGRNGSRGEGKRGRMMDMLDGLLELL